ncbi:MAG: helix-turn-helix domain-containing protein [Acidobacteriaceae bacterium]|nr:helix-turn-helix domain-containing protein [Acidobacteriaceae bacterium]
MAQERVSLRKSKEILRRPSDLGLRQDQIARSCQIGQATVHRYLERFAASGVAWPFCLAPATLRLGGRSQ